MAKDIIEKYGHRVGYTQSQLDLFHKGGHRIRQVERLSQAAPHYSIEAEVIDLRPLVPLDMATVIESVKKTNRVIVASEECERAGVCAELGLRISQEAFDYLDAPVARVATADVPVPFSPPLEKYMMAKADEIVLAATKLMNGNMLG